MNRMKILVAGPAVVLAIAVVVFVTLDDGRPKMEMEVGPITGINEANTVPDNREHTTIQEVQKPSSLKMILHCSGSAQGKPYYQKEPIALSVGIQDERFFDKAVSVADINESGKKPFTMGTSEWPWFRGLTMKIDRIEKPAGGETKMVPVLEELDWSKQITSPLSGAGISNQPVQYSLICSFLIDPNTSESLVSGQYVVTAVWDSTEGPARNLNVWHGRLEAEPVEITIKRAETKEELGMRAFSRACYYIREKDYDSALREALETEKVYAGCESFRCYTIAAMAYHEKGDIKSEIKYYRKYLDAHKDSNPQRNPYIRRVKNRVENLERQLDNANEVTK